MSDLITRLRYAAQGELFGDTLLEEAADRIEVLELEVDMWRTHVPDLEADLAKAKLSNKGMHKTIARLTDRIVELEATIKRIEKILHERKDEMSTETWHDFNRQIKALEQTNEQ